MSNVSAGAFDTLSWLMEHPRIAIPVYQREYRWREEVCEQLLSDIRAVAAQTDGRSPAHLAARLGRRSLTHTSVDGAGPTEPVRRQG